MAVAGSDYVVVAADTRLSTGYSIHTRYAPKIIQLYISQYIIHMFLLLFLILNSHLLSSLSSTHLTLFSQ